MIKTAKRYNKKRKTIKLYNKKRKTIKRKTIKGGLFGVLFGANLDTTNFPRLIEYVETLRKGKRFSDFFSKISTSLFSLLSLDREAYKRFDKFCRAKLLSLINTTFFNKIKSQLIEGAEFDNKDGLDNDEEYKIKFYHIWNNVTNTNQIVYGPKTLIYSNSSPSIWWANRYNWEEERKNLIILNDFQTTTAAVPKKSISRDFVKNVLSKDIIRFKKMYKDMFTFKYPIKGDNFIFTQTDNLDLEQRELDYIFPKQEDIKYTKEFKNYYNGLDGPLGIEMKDGGITYAVDPLAHGSIDSLKTKFNDYDSFVGTICTKEYEFPPVYKDRYDNKDSLIWTYRDKS